jgi:hypothetical protein
VTAESHRTSFFALTDVTGTDDDLAVARIEIPIFQRDYAQGRDSDAVRRIRTDFLDVLRVALDGGAPTGLDFVYGGVEEGTLRPLDGQQRLTTLFLLHWYVASRAGRLGEEHGWKNFSYATRQSARMFCESLVADPLPHGATPSEWIADRPWYLFLWRHDPTVQSMLVMLDAIHERFEDIDPGATWQRLTDPEDPAIWFLLLPLSGLGTAEGEDMRAEDLYIKMNSRGKPLTEFENFKAHFEKTIQWSARSDEFALKVDTVWSDLLWHLRGDDDIIDDEFLRYLDFVTEICEWREGRTDGAGKPIGPRTQAVFGAGNPQRVAHLSFLFDALDTWVGKSISETFDALFAGAGDTTGDGKVRLFFRSEAGTQEPVNLFEACCRSFGEVRGGRTRTFSLGQSLLLYAVLLHLIEDTSDLPRRVRVLRNLVEASTDELRIDRMPKILDDVHHVIGTGAIGDVSSLNQAQADDEIAKADFLAAHPDLTTATHALEDHPLLRGSIGAFELDAEALSTRASAFHQLMSDTDSWPDLLGALLAVGEYQRQRTNSRPFLFGTDSKRHDDAWRQLLTGPTRDGLRPTRDVLGTFLDRIAGTPATATRETMSTITSDYLTRCEADRRFDWRYYMVKYPTMRGNGSSIYFAERFGDGEPLAMGYSLCMLKAGHSTLSGYYRDPYLLTIAHELEDPTIVKDEWFSGYESEPRRLPLARSGTTIRCTPAGFELVPPPLDEDAERFESVRAELDIDDDNLVAIAQVEVEGRGVDTVDRIQVGAGIVAQLHAAGL